MVGIHRRPGHVPRPHRLRGPHSHPLRLSPAHYCPPPATRAALGNALGLHQAGLHVVEQAFRRLPPGAASAAVPGADPRAGLG
jgi:hypothetical protein